MSTFCVGRMRQPNNGNENLEVRFGQAIINQNANWFYQLAFSISFMSYSPNYIVRAAAIVSGNLRYLNKTSFGAPTIPDTTGRTLSISCG